MSTLSSALKKSALLSLIVFLTACSSLQKSLDVSKPKAQVTGVSISDLSTKSITLLADVKVTNPNSFKLKTAGFDLDLWVNKAKLVSLAQPDAALSLPAKGSRQVALPVTLTFDQLLKSVEGLGDKTEIEYAIKGNVAIDLPVLGKVNVPVNHEGIIPVPKQPKVSFKKVTLDSVGFTGAKLHVDLDILNPNTFDVSFSGIRYILTSQNETLGGGEMAEVTLLSGQSKSLTIPLNIMISDLGSSVFRALTGSQAIDLGIDIKADLDTSLDGWKTTEIEFNHQQSVNK